ncbi:hypothetical protein V7O66_09155 [Methanolobus sp. ZRKC3]|uniref:prenylated flavin chaperone LpdD n=1 Tax=Methanolobus sp. ZRKC3 TaxID=3125786 RepID=UPI003253AC05
MKRLCRELLGTQLILEWKKIGDDIVVTLTGGDEHVGAVATGSFDKKSGRSYASVLSLPGHREDEIALNGAKMFSAASRSTTVFIVGIHLDNITKKEIMDIVKVSKEMVGELSAILEEGH